MTKKPKKCAMCENEVEQFAIICYGCFKLSVTMENRNDCLNLVGENCKLANTFCILTKGMAKAHCICYTNKLNEG